jgi:hypothetical protein
MPRPAEKKPSMLVEAVPRTKNPTPKRKTK